MIILGIDASTVRSSVCLGSPSGLLATAALGRPQAHGEFLVPAITFCLERAGVGIDAVEGVAVSVGPGLYTGMRVGIATAQALAHSRQLPVVGQSTLDVVAHAYRDVAEPRTLFAVLDAKRGELFWAGYRADGEGLRRVTDQRVGPPDKLASEVEATGGQPLCAGDGARAHATLLAAAGGRIAVGQEAPSALAVVELSLPRFLAQDTQRAEDLRAVYLRQPDARISWRNRGALYGGPGDGADPPAAGPEGSPVAGGDLP